MELIIDNRESIKKYFNDKNLEWVKFQNLDLGELTLIKDSKVQLYTGKSTNNKKGNIHYREELVETPFRLIVAKTKTDNSKAFWFITNNFELTPK